MKIPIGTPCLIVCAPAHRKLEGMTCTVEGYDFQCIRKEPYQYAISIPNNPSHWGSGLWGADYPKHIIPLSPDDIDTEAEHAMTVLIDEYAKVRKEHEQT